MKLFSLLKSANRSELRRHRLVAKAKRPSLLSQSDFFDGLEKRQLLAAFSLSGGVVNLDLNVANQVMSIASTGTTYTFTLTGGATNTWTGTAAMGVSASGSVLTANATALLNFDMFNISDSQANTTVVFGNSGANVYKDRFYLVLNNNSNAVLFNGTSSFSDSNLLTIQADSRVEMLSGSCLTMADGDLNMNINMQASPRVLNYSGLLVNNATIQTTGNGTTNITARGGVGLASSYLNKGVAVVSGGKIMGGTTGTMNITGYAYTGVDGGVQGQGVYVYNLGGSANSVISSIGANVSVTGYGANSTSIASTTPLNAGVVLGNMTTTSGTGGGLITSGGNGTVTITGYGGTLANQSASYFGASYGVYLNGTNTTITSGGGGLVTVQGYGGGANANTACGMGVLVYCGTITSGTNGSVVVNGTGCTTANSQRNHGVYLSGTTSNIAAGPGTGTTTVVGQAGGCGSITTNEGVYIDGGTITAFGSGNVTVTGNGSTAATSSRGIFLWGSLSTPATITSNGGAVLVTGYGGGTGTGASNLGVQIQSSTITAGGLASVTVLGYGGNNNGTAGDTNYGVNVDSGGSGGQPGKITSSGGNVVVTGTGGGGAADSPVASSSKNNTGVLVNQGGYITAGGSGTVNVTGYGGGRSPGATGGQNYGVQVSAANSTTANTAIYSYIGSSGGAVSVTGFGGAGSGTTSASSGWYNYGVYVYNGGKITSGGNADVTVNGTGGGFGNSSSSSGVNSGVLVATSNIIANLGETFPTITSGGNGNVTITGQGGGSTGSGANNWGVGVQAGGLVTSGGMGTVSITGVAGDSAIGNQNVGVWVCQTTSSNVSSTVTSGGGNVVVNGTGGGKNSQYNIGVLVSDSALITAPGTASVSVTGRAGNANSTSTSATQATGVWVYGSTAKQIRPKITSTNGTVTVTGYGGNSNTSLTSSAGSNYGVQVSQGGEISSGGTAPVTVTGNGGGLSGGTSTDNVGVIVSTLGPGNLPGQISSSGGPITVTGFGGSKNPLNSGLGSSHGVSIAAGGQITTTGSGTSINITGTGGGGNPNGSATNHGILIAGCATLSNFTITSNGGPITLNATEGLGSQSRGITTTANAVIGNATTPGNITILTNSANLSNSTNAAINSAGSLLIAPITPGVGVTLGCTTDSRGGPLTLSAAELNTLNTGTIQLGNSSTGNFTVSASVTVPAASNLTLLSNSTPTTGIRSNGTITMGAGKLLDVSALPSVNTQVNGTTPLTQYSQLNVTGNLSIAGRSLNLYGSYTPVSGDVFTIANATSLTGTFTGLAEGSTTTFNGRTLLVNYTPTTATLTEPTPKVTTQPTGSTVTAGTQVNFTANATGIPAPDVQWQVLVPGGSWSNITNATSPTYSFNSASGDNGNQYRAYFTNTYGNATSSAVSLTVQFAPSITTQPTNQTVNDGQTATFTAAASGNPTPTVRWQSSPDSTNWTDISGATATSYTTGTLSTSNSGTQYRALFTNSITADVATNVVTLTVNAATSAPSITTQPTNQTATAGATATFIAAATGNPTPTVKWQSSPDGTNWTDITGATSDSYTTPTLAAGDNGTQFRAIYTNGIGSDATTNVATLTVNYAPSISTQPTNQTANAGATATFTAAATGNPTPTVKWQSSPDGTSWTDISGATADSYTTPTLAAGDNGTKVRAIYTNGVGSDATTNVATLTVNAATSAPVITGQPVSIGVEAGQTASFTATATGNPTPAVQWQSSPDGSTGWADITGATSGTLSFTATAGDNGKYYRAVFSNGISPDATTNAAKLSIGVAPVITTASEMTIPVALTSGMTVIATGSPAPTYSITQGSLPAGVTLDSTTGLLSGTPAAGTAGSWPITIKADNGIGNGVTQNFSLKVTSTVTSFTVSKGIAQRSYIRYLDLGMDSNASALALLNNPGRVQLTRADLNGVGSTPVPLNGFLKVATGSSTLGIDFGTVGLGNSRNTTTADGYYTLGVDLDGNGTFETNLFFFRLLGDTNGDREVTAADQSAVLAGCSQAYNANLDVNGDGVVNTSDYQYVKKSVGRKLKSTLIVTA